MLIRPEDYGSTSAYDLLAAATRGHLIIDQRAMAAITADPARSLPEVLRFAAEDRSKDRFDVSEDMMALFAIMPTPDALPYLLSEILRFPDSVPDRMLEALLPLGAPAVDALFQLIDSGQGLGEDSDVPFLAAALGRQTDPRVLALIERTRATDPAEAGFLEEVSEGEPEPPRPYDYRRDYPEEAEPDLDQLEEADIREFLASPDARFRQRAVRHYLNAELSDAQVKRFLKMGAEDPDALVRGLAWETLREYSDQDDISKPMFERLGTPGVDPVESASLACALAYFYEQPLVSEAIEAAYGNPLTRAKALEAMWRTLDRKYVPRVEAHLHDKNIAVLSEAVTATGFLRMRDQLPRLTELLRDDDLRQDAIYAYMLAAPVPVESRFEYKQLATRLEKLAGGFAEFEEEIAETALATRLELSGRHNHPDAENKPAASAKVGRNDPCPCGSGKKHKKCHGA